MENIELTGIGDQTAQLLEPFFQTMAASLLPVLALILWTMLMWFAMYFTRIPAMSKAKIDPDEARHPGTYVDRLPANVRAVADNYNHLHEQPTLFYALMLFAALTGGGGELNTMLGWVYVAARVLHSLVQIFVPRVVPRFVLFSLGSFVLFAIALKEALRVFL